MPVRVTLRSTSDCSPYREMLSYLIASPDADSLILCSGFVQEGRWNYSILDDGLLDCIKNGCAKGRVIIIAGSEDKEWYQAYLRFIDRLEEADIQVVPLIAPRNNWHAKIAMRLKGDIPTAALIGSSNLTRRAWEEGYEHIKWNFEGDVLIWQDEPILNAYFGPRLQIPVRFGDLQLILDPSVKQPNEQEQLLMLQNYIRHSGIKRLKR